MKYKHVIYLLMSIFVLGACSSTKKAFNVRYDSCGRAGMTLDSIYKYYAVEGKFLMRETYPFDSRHNATYLNDTVSQTKNQYSYLWPYSGLISAVNALYESTHDNKYRDILEQRVLPGLEEYYDDNRTPAGYASYINSAKRSDRFYDDNIWIGIDFTDMYQLYGNKRYLDKALQVWQFVGSGLDDRLGYGIYWVEQNKNSKNTCSNAPAAVYALKLYKATDNKNFLLRGKTLYDWTKQNLQDTQDGLYFDKIQINGSIDKAKYSYNSGQMMQAAVLLYEITGEKRYLTDARQLAAACHNKWFSKFQASGKDSFYLLNDKDIWFAAVMLRGFIELYTHDGDPSYLNCFHNSLDHSWTNSRDENGLFNRDLRGVERDTSKWLLTQAAMAEMYARLNILKSKK